MIWDFHWTTHCFGLDSKTRSEETYVKGAGSLCLQNSIPAGSEQPCALRLGTHFFVFWKYPKHSFTSFWWFRLVLQISTATKRLKLSLHHCYWHGLRAFKNGSRSFSSHCPSAGLPSCSYGSGSISFSLLILLSTTQLTSNPLHLIFVNYETMLETCLN